MTCDVCGGDGYVIVNYGHTVNPDGSLGGRGIRSLPCECTTPIPPSPWRVRCERCGTTYVGRCPNCNA